MSKKRSKKKPSKETVKEIQEDFWDLGDDDIEQEPEETKEKKTDKKKPSKKSSSSPKPASKKSTKDKDSEIENKKTDSSDEDVKLSDDDTDLSDDDTDLSDDDTDLSDDDTDLSDDDTDLSDDDLDLSDDDTDLSDDDLDIPEDETDLSDDDLDISAEIENSKAYKTAEPTKTKPKLTRKKETGSHAGTKEAPPTTILEKISLLIVVTCLLGALVWGLSTFLKDAPQGEIVPFKEDYPAKGKDVTISSVKTWWREPVRSGDNIDVGVVLESNLIPCAKITLLNGKSTTLRVTFRNGEKQLIGDTINLTIENGKFVRSGSNSVEIYSTSGFANDSEIHAYNNGDIDPWSLTITEGDTGDESDALVKARISASSSDQ